MTRVPAGMVDRVVRTAVPQLVGAAMQQLPDMLDRLGLRWRLRPATVVDGTSRLQAVTAVYDGDTEQSRMISLVGPLAARQRVTVLAVPPAGAYVIGTTPVVARCRAYHSTLVSLGNGSLTVLPLQSTTWDVSSRGAPMHDNVTNNSRIYLPFTGQYTVIAQAGFASNSTGRRTVTVRVNAAGSSVGGTQVGVKSDQANASSSHQTLCVFEYGGTAGDYLEVFPLQQSGGALNTAVGAEVAFMSVRLTEVTGS